LLQALLERLGPGLSYRIVNGPAHEHANPPHPLRLLRAHLKRRSRQSASNEQNEIASSHFPHHGQNYGEWKRLQQGILTGEMGLNRHFAQQQFDALDGRNGSKATFRPSWRMSAIAPKATAIATCQTVARCQHKGLAMFLLCTFC
jgi:hypothetical protein